MRVFAVLVCVGLVGCGERFLPTDMGETPFDLTEEMSASDMPTTPLDMPGSADAPIDLPGSDMSESDAAEMSEPDIPAEDMPAEDMPVQDMPRVCDEACQMPQVRCERDMLVTPTGVTQDAECECQEQATRVDCAATGDVCRVVDGVAGCQMQMMPAVCPPDMTFQGQMAGFSGFDGGVYFGSDTALSQNAGLTQVYDYIAQQNTLGTLPLMGSYELPLAEQIQVAGATITSTRAAFMDLFFDEGFITFQDRQRAMVGFIEQGGVPLTDSSGAPLELRVGQRVSFTVTRVSVFGGMPQISAISNVQVNGSNVQVYVREATGQTFTADDWGEMVRVGGQITSTQGLCGGSSTCYDLTHGGQTITIRSALNNVQVGDCYTFVGPLSSFPGPLDLNPRMQLDTTNFSWVRFNP